MKNQSSASRDMGFIYSFYFVLEQILKTIKQRNKNLIKNIFVSLLNNFISTNRKEVKFCFYPPIGPNKIVQQEKEKYSWWDSSFVVLLFLKSAPWIILLLQIIKDRKMYASSNFSEAMLNFHKFYNSWIHCVFPVFYKLLKFLTLSLALINQFGPKE